MKSSLITTLSFMAVLCLCSQYAISQQTDPPPPDEIAGQKAKDEAAAKKAAENEKLNKKAIDEIDKKLKNLDKIKDVDKVKALEAMKKYIQDHLKEDPSTVLDQAAKAAKKAIATGDKIEDAGSSGMVDDLKSDLAKEIFGILMEAKGTGRTTGHIANLLVTNTDSVPIVTVAQTVYIPSDGQYQPYIARIPEGILIPPNGTVTISLYGYCADPHVPPVSNGADFPSPEDNWIPVGEPQVPSGSDDGVPVILISTDPVPTFTPEDIPGITSTPAFTPSDKPGDDIVITWPGTDIPVEGTLNPESDPRDYAKVIVDVLERLEDAVVIIQEDEKHNTPFSPDPVRERDAILQHDIWWYTGAITGDPYEEEDFAENVYDQFEASTGKPVTALPPEQKAEIDSGIADFWNVFQATGVEAKVIKAQPEPEEQEPPIEIVDKGGCNGEIDLKMNPPYELDMKITEQWGSADERQARVKEVNDALGKEIQITPEGAFAAYDINRHPTSSTSFWKAGNVGGFASAYAKTWFKKADGSSEWVWGTEKLETRADGTMDYSMTYTHDEECRAMVAGSALIRIRASSSAFDAMAGNTNLENDTEQLNFLRTTKYFGKKAAEWLILKARGRANKSFANFVKDDLQDQLEGAISDAVVAEAQALADQALGGLLGEMGISFDQMLNMELPSLEGMLEDLFGVDIPSFEDLTNFISDGLEAAFNLPFVANTYATANGSLVVKVGGNSGSVLAHTSVHYARQSTEETKDAMTWKGEDCKEDLISDAQPDALTIHTQGFSNMVAEAVSRYGFGNGQAEAFLESMNLQILSGICICPGERKGIDQSSYELNVQGHMEWYTADEGQQQALETALESMLQNVEDQMIEELDAMSEDAVNNLTTDQFEKMLADKVRAWGDANKFAWSACKN